MPHTTTVDPATYAGEVRRVRALAATVRHAEARFYAAIREARDGADGRPVITRADLATAAGVPEQTLMDRLASHEQARAQQEATR